MRYTPQRAGRVSKLPAGGIQSVLVAAFFVIAAQAATGGIQPADAQARPAQVAVMDAGANAADPASRRTMLIPFGEGLWVPVEGAQPIRIADDQMSVVGMNEAMRIYARAGGGGGGPTSGDWQAGQVYVRVAPGQYWPLQPKGATAPVAPRPAMDQRPASDPRSLPAPQP